MKRNENAPETYQKRAEIDWADAGSWVTVAIVLIVSLMLAPFSRAQSVWPSIPPPEYDHGHYTATIRNVANPDAECRVAHVHAEGSVILACYDAMYDEIIMPNPTWGDSEYRKALLRHEEAHARGFAHGLHWPR